MKIKRVSELMLDIKQEFDKDPYHWHILRGRDSKAHTNTFVCHEDKKLWQFKTELKNPLTPIGVGTCVKRNINDELQELMNTGTNVPIHEVYPNKDNFVVAMGLGKYSQDSTNQLKDILTQDIPKYGERVENKIDMEFQKILKKEQLLHHYI